MRKGLTATAILCGFAALLLVTAPAAEQGTEGDRDAASVPADVPESARTQENPRAGHQQSIDNGKQIFTSQCTMCHGANGDGKGDLYVFNGANWSKAYLGMLRSTGNSRERIE